MKNVYRINYPWYIGIPLIVMLLEIVFLIINFVNLDKIKIFYDNMPANIIILSICLISLLSLPKKHFLFSYDNDTIQIIRKNLIIKWQDVKEWRIEKVGEDYLNIPLDSINNKNNYILVLSTVSEPNVSIFLGSISKSLIVRIKKIFKNKVPI